MFATPNMFGMPNNLKERCLFEANQISKRKFEAMLRGEKIMINTAALHFSISIIMLMLITSIVSAEEKTTLTPPELHANVAMQLEVYSGGDSTYVTAIPRAAENATVIRHACIEAEGELGKYIEYGLEIGAASCQRGGIMLMEAGVYYKPLPYLKMGLMKGHILRGFEIYEECINVTTAEKPVFAKKFSPCHPTGALIETDYDIDETMGIHVQFTYMNGVGGSFEDEHDINLGFQFRTPLQGLAVGGFYTDWQWNRSRFNNYYDSLSEQWVLETITDVYNGYRTGFGYNYDQFNVHLRGEYYLGKGFEDRFYSIEKVEDEGHHGRGSSGANDEYVLREVPFEDTKMKACFIEGGYCIDIGQPQLSYIQPYIQYQWWDQSANLDDDYVFSFLTFGVTLGIGPNDSKLRIEYQTPLSFPDENMSGLIPYSEEQAANRLIVRIQAGI
jgi:hypothetical protein